MTLFSFEKGLFEMCIHRLTFDYDVICAPVECQRTVTILSRTVFYVDFILLRLKLFVFGEEIFGKCIFGLTTGFCRIWSLKETSRTKKLILHPFLVVPYFGLTLLLFGDEFDDKYIFDIFFVFYAIRTQQHINRPRHWFQIPSLL